MDANRLEEIKQSYADECKWAADPKEVRELLLHIDQQQAEIERLNRAYEVMSQQLVAVSPAAHKAATDQAQRIKEGKDGEQG